MSLKTKKHILSQTWGTGRVVCVVLYTIYNEPITRELIYGDNLLKSDTHTISDTITVTELDQLESYTAFENIEDLISVLDINSPNYIEFESALSVTKLSKTKVITKMFPEFFI